MFSPGGCADKIGEDAVSGNRFNDDYSIFADNNAYRLNTAWQVMDGQDADCITLSTLMKYELDLLGVTGSEVRCVFARHESWTGLSSTDRFANEIKDGNPDNRLVFWFGGLDSENIYEGCCVVELPNGTKQWWMGGIGEKRYNAYEVWNVITKNNQSGLDKPHQCWQQGQSQLIAVSPPSGIPSE
jgi:hypothetical protein